MRSPKNLTFRTILLALVSLLIVPAMGLTQSSSDKKEIDFLYAFGAYAGPQGKGKTLSVQSETKLRAGDRLKVYFEPMSDMYFYLLHISSQGELTSLHPPTGLPARVAGGTPMFIPAGNKWFELDGHPGQEKFFFIWTADRLDRLEQLCAHHAALTAPAEVKPSVEAILEEVKQLRQKHQQLSAPAEKPVRIGGSVRGQRPTEASGVPDITPLAVEVKAPGFFSRTFTIDHR